MAGAGVGLALLACLLTVGPVLAEPLVIEARPVTLDPADPARNRLGDLIFLGGLELSSADERFGGLSGLVIAGDGLTLLAITDHGQWIAARMIHDRTGVLTGIGEAEITAMRDADGNPLTGRQRDAEALAALADGRYGVGFERDHRIAVFPGYPFTPGDNRTDLLTPPLTLLDAPENKGIEALVEIAPGRLLAVTEGLFSGLNRLRGWLISSDRPGVEPQALTYRIKGELRPTALALIPGGDVLALERAYSLIGGLKVRLVRFAVADVVPGAVLSPIEVARFDDSLTVDNFEGLAVRRDARDRILVYMLSDDNFNGFQRTLLMQFQLVYEGAP